MKFEIDQISGKTLTQTYFSLTESSNCNNKLVILSTENENLLRR